MNSAPSSIGAPRDLSVCVRTLPPIRSRASRIKTDKPERPSRTAAASPAIPAPTTITSGTFVLFRMKVVYTTFRSPLRREALIQTLRLMLRVYACDGLVRCQLDDDFDDLDCTGLPLRSRCSSVQGGVCGTASRCSRTVKTRLLGSHTDGL